MDALRGHHAKQNKSDRKRQIFCDLIYMCKPPKKGKHRETESREHNSGYQKLEVGGNGEMLVKGYNPLIIR